jgi:hypothetical protein
METIGIGLRSAQAPHGVSAVHPTFLQPSEWTLRGDAKARVLTALFPKWGYTTSGDPLS